MLLNLTTAERKFGIIAGAPRTGKSRISAQIIKAANRAGQLGFIYNASPRADNFPEAALGELLTMKEHRKLNPEADFFYLYKIGGKLRDIRNINRDFYAKAVKFPRLFPSRDEAEFFSAFKNHVSHSTLIIDDCKELFRHGAGEEEISLFSKINHSGAQHADPRWRGAGCNVFLVFHSLEDINPIFWQYCTDLIQFRTPKRPNFDLLPEEVQAELFQAWEELKTAPKFSYTHHVITETY